MPRKTADCTAPPPGGANLLFDLVDFWAERTPQSVALRYQQQDWTYATLKQNSIVAARDLSARGVTWGDRVATFMPNRPEIVELALGASRIGAILVPINPLLKTRQLAHILADSGAKTLVALRAQAQQIGSLVGAHTNFHALQLAFIEGGASSAFSRRPSSHDVASLSIKAHQGGRPIDRDPAAILYTSGSTGRAKGVVVSHANLVSGAESVATYLRNSADDRILAALPLSFDYGLSQVTTALYAGACAVLTNYSLPVALMQEVAAEQITGLAGVPTMWAHISSAEWPIEYSESLRYITNSGGALRCATIKRLRAQMRNARVFCMYGLTEAFRSTYLDPDELDRRPGSIGKPIPNQEILVLRPDGSHCAPEEPGELVHRGSLVSLGYWNLPEETAEKFRPLASTQGILAETVVWSGDVVRRDSDGFLYFIGRNDEMIKTSGHRVSPFEVEEVVAEVPGVAEATVLGLPDPLLGQRMVVAIVAAGVADDFLLDAIRKHCRQHLPSYMVPAEIHFVARLPLNANHKPDRAELARILSSGTSESEESTPTVLQKSASDDVGRS